MKFLSRKFLICAAAFLGSIGASITALHTDNPKVATIGIVCAMLSAAIYAAVEAYVDGKAVNLYEDDIDFEDWEEDDIEDIETRDDIEAEEE